NWQALQPELSITELSAEKADFWSLQKHATKAIFLYLKQPRRSLLVLKADDQAEYADLLAELIRKEQPKERSVFGVNYVVEQGDSFSFPRIYTEPAQSPADNFAAQGDVLKALHADQFSLFGSVRVHPSSQDILLTPGLVHQANGGVLILSAATMLSYPLNLKVVILGNRTEIATLGELEEDLYSLADYAEIESYYSVAQPKAQENWANYVLALASKYELDLDLTALNKLYQLLVRESEDRFLISISPLKTTEMLLNAATLSQKQTLSAVDFEQAFKQKNEQHGFLRERTYADILNEQIYVETNGEIVGQINGLSVIEYPGTPVCFGEPSRISCLVQFGDGEVVDVERKNELAGNLHGKGMMISEACLASILELPSQLPFSASLVFEQSYGEIDGDSASLAIFSVLVSALSDLPLPQNIAITGTIDQFGLVHAVGGVNDKIEGFFTICQRRGLTGKQGVIIPATTIQQLSLSDEVVEAVKNEQFFIYQVEDIYQTAKILFDRDLLEEKEEYAKGKEPIARLIQNRIAFRSETPKKNWLDFFKS
ncbi:MAG: Lon protease family protein, partial [Haemophilus parainfluenzae]|nr:Lon protease family protein [Haemophilus parainfluenzae]